MKETFDSFETNLIEYKDVKRSIKNYPSSTREWNNSIYTFNKNSYSLIPYLSKLTLKLTKSYFNAFNFYIEKKTRRKYKFNIRLKRFLSNRVFISNGNFKHTNDKIIVTFYVYNRQKSIYTFFIKKFLLEFLKINLLKKLLYLKSKADIYIKKENVYDLYVFNSLPTAKWQVKYTKDYEKFYITLIKIILKKYKKYFFFKQLLYINKSKFNYNYLSYLAYLLKKNYNKNVQFNIVNLKSFYLNSDIFTNFLLTKIKRNRTKMRPLFKRFISKSKTIKISRFLAYKPKIKNAILNNENNLNYLILNNLYKNKLSAKKTIFSLIKYKKLSGLKIQAKGRLTKRYTAARSLNHFKSKGNLINIDSSFLGLSSVLLKGNLKSNIQYTKLYSNTRIGSFGLKGWMSAY